MYLLHREQIVDAPLRAVWEFIQNPANLNAITPGFLDFIIVSDIPETIYNGLIIEYRIRIPYLGYRRWVAEIKHVREPFSFVDEQRVGPYRFWYHFHELKETAQGVRMIDRVYYRTPFSVFGRLAHFFFIQKTLERIFDYRKGQFGLLLKGAGNSGKNP
ncbi:MAG: SRPBCC family protein [Thermodesulfobacteriota bacterium]